MESKRSKVCFAQNEEVLDIVFNNLAKSMPEECRVEFFYAVKHGIGGFPRITNYCWPATRWTQDPFSYHIDLSVGPTQWFQNLRCLQLYLKLDIGTNYVVECLGHCSIIRAIEKLKVIKSILGDRLSERTVLYC